MPRFASTRRVAHPAARMFDLVADVERYPEFVPMVERLEIKRRAASGDGVVTLVADMGIGYRVIREHFISRVALDRPRLRILVEYVDGPFRYLENRWTFRDVPGPDGGPGGCDVGFAIDYEFRSRAFGLLAGAVFETVYRRMVSAFEERADALYGRGAA